MLFILIQYYIFLIWTLALEARAEIQKYFRSLFGSNENFKICFRDLLTYCLLHWGSCNRQSNGFPICRKTLETILFERIGVFQMLSWFSQCNELKFCELLWNAKSSIWCKSISWETCQDFTTWNHQCLDGLRAKTSGLKSNLFEV